MIKLIISREVLDEILTYLPDKLKNKLLPTKLRASKFRQELLDKQTPSEKVFKKKLIKAKIKFEEQKVIYFKDSFFIVDFYLPDYKLIIEVDGGYHYTKDKLKSDRIRTINLKKIGYKYLLRYSNKKAETITIETLLKNITKAIL